jgi:hypothetical protein
MRRFQNFVSMKILISAVLVGVVAQSALGCDLCAVYSAIQARSEADRGPFAGLAEQFTHFASVQVDGHEIADPSHQYMDSWISQVFAGYNFSDRFGVQFNVPIIYRSFKRPDDAGGIDRGTEAGIADVYLLGTYVPYRKLKKDSTITWALIAGVKFPTGSSDRLKEEFNEVEEPIGPPSVIHGHDLALGSGSFDGIVGSTLFARWKRSFLSANIQYAIRSAGDFDYRYANDLTWSGGPGYYLLLHDDYSLSLQAVVSGEQKGKDEFAGEVAEDTGVTSVFLGPQLNFTWGEKLSAFLGADLPVSIDNTALQTVPDYRIRGGLTWHF